MVYRNGALAETLRNAGFPHKIIFGLNLPQIMEIWSHLTFPDFDTAMQLFNDREVRESRLLAPFLFPTDMALSILLPMLKDLRTREEADIFAFRNLRYRKDAAELANQVEEFSPYIAQAIRRFL